MKIKLKKHISRILFVILSFAIIMFVMFQVMKTKTDQALKNQKNIEIDMSKIRDGIYHGKSNGGMVSVEVEVEVENHVIKDIKLLKHDNAKGKNAETMIDDMILYNTDNVDIVSGATASSKTIRNAVNNALQQGLN